MACMAIEVSIAQLANEGDTPSRIPTIKLSKADDLHFVHGSCLLRYDHDSLETCVDVTHIIQ